MTDATGFGPAVRAAGVVVTRLRDGQREFLVVHRPRYDDWSLPKGKLDAGEKFAAAAQREIREETGSKTRRLARLGSIAYNSANQNAKLVRYWLFEHVSGKFKPNTEVDEVRWLSAADVIQLLTYPRDREVFTWGATLADSPRAGRIHLVRHAKAGRRSAWEGDDADRPLSRSGRRQALLLSSHLTTSPVSRIYASSATRCTQTVTPLGLAIDEKVRSHKALLEGARAADLEKAFTAVEGSAVVMCSHGAEISNILDRVVASGAHLESRPEALPEKGSIWVLELTAGLVISGRYVPAPA
jgi:8-oxo-dGTP diphosphatase